MKRVLLVEDEVTIVRVLERFLKREGGYTVFSAGSPPEALRVFREQQPFHVLLCDVYLGRDDGWELAEKIYVSDPTIRVLMMSGALMRDDMPRQLEYAMLHKPFNQIDLRRAIQAL